MDVLGSLKGDKTHKFTSQLSVDGAISNFPKSALGMPPFVLQFAYKTLSATIKSRMNGVSAKFVNGGDLMTNGVGKAVYEDFLLRALEEGMFVTAPEAQVVGRGSSMFRRRWICVSRVFRRRRWLFLCEYSLLISRE